MVPTCRAGLCRTEESEGVYRDGFVRRKQTKQNNKNRKGGGGKMYSLPPHYRV
uniref:Uncharacterized protein n=1 Tax=Anguilla anguilla TaxID=7936 RepID=A0A0E9WHZ6_ANGAN